MSSSITHQRLIYVLAVILMAVCYGCSSHKTTVTGNGHSVPTRPVVKRHVNMNATSEPHSRRLLTEAEKWLGTPYKYGGTTRGEGVDCSGLVMSLYIDALSIKLPRNSAAQAEFCNAIEREQLEVGDLVFFAPRSSGRVNHVGMYIGDGDMIHASGSRGVMISSLSEPYFAKNFYRCGRVPSKTSPKPTPSKNSNTSKNFNPSNTSTTSDTIPPRRVLDEAIEQRVDSICSAFFD